MLSLPEILRRDPKRQPSSVISAARPRGDTVARVRAGDPEAFRELFRAHRADVARFVHRLTANGVAIDELVEEVFVEVRQRIGRYRAVVPLSVWIRRVTLQVIARHQGGSGLHEGDAVSEPPHDGGERARGIPASPRGERVEVMRQLLARLDARDRAAYVLHELEGLPVRDVAAVVEEAETLVQRRLHEAERRLTHLLRDEARPLPRGDDGA